jgi:hypothetical protein
MSKGTPITTSFIFYVFRVVAAFTPGRMVPVQFQTGDQYFGDLPLLPLSRDDGGPGNLWNVGLGYCLASTKLLASFLFGLVSKEPPSDKTTLLKNLGNASYDGDNIILFNFAYASAM